jgi:hypothetical protein
MRDWEAKDGNHHNQYVVPLLCDLFCHNKQLFGHASEILSLKVFLPAREAEGIRKHWREVFQGLGRFYTNPQSMSGLLFSGVGILPRFFRESNLRKNNGTRIRLVFS